MNIQQFTVPALAAAALHAALLALPGGPKPVVHFSPPRPLVDLRPMPVDPPVPPAPTEPDPDVMAVQPLRGDVTSDFKPDREPVPTHADSWVPVEVQPFRAEGPSPTNFGHPGDPNGVPDGVPRVLLLSSDQLDTVPRALAQPSPAYPAALRHDGVSGTVRVEFVVDASGRVVRATVLDSTRREFEEPTLRAILKWKFEPGRYHGRPVPFRMAVPVQYRVDTL